MPPFRKIVAATGQNPVYFAATAHKSNGGASSGFPVELGGTKELHAAFLTESRTREHWWCRIQKSGSPHLLFPTYPDFLSRLVALSHSMRLSLKKAAHAILSDAA